MKEIAELRKEIEEKIYEKRNKFNYISTYFYFLSTFILGSIGLLYVLIGIAGGIGLVLAIIKPEIGFFAGAIIFVIGILAIIYIILVLPFTETSKYEKEISTINEKEVVKRLRELLTSEEAKKLKEISSFLSKAGKYYLFSKEDIERWKILVNYELEKLTSYPNKLGSNLKWSEWQELKNAGLIHDDREIQKKIEEKLEKLRSKRSEK